MRGGGGLAGSEAEAMPSAANAPQQQPVKTTEALAYKSAVEVAAQRAIRAALDPKRIMNPRVLF